jgi:phage baseplate assembly protein V
MIAMIDARISRAMARMRLAFRGVLSRADAAPVQLVQIDALAGEQLQAAELMQQFGFTSNPPPGTMVVVLPIGGQTAHGVVIACEHGSYRLAGLAPGETAIYNQWGDCVMLKSGGIAEVHASTKIRMVTPLLEVTGDVVDLCDAGGHSMAAMRTIYDSHTHPGDSGGTTGAPNQTI